MSASGSSRDLGVYAPWYLLPREIRGKHEADGEQQQDVQVELDGAPVGAENTGLNVVDVRDVARGHALALERGDPGERYLLGGANLSLEDLFAVIARLAGRRRPRLRVPYAVAEMAGALGIVNRDEVRLARLPMYFSSEKAVSRLGYEPGPVEPALARAVAEALRKGGA